GARHGGSGRRPAARRGDGVVDRTRRRDLRRRRGVRRVDRDGGPRGDAGGGRRVRGGVGAQPDLDLPVGVAAASHHLDLGDVGAADRRRAAAARARRRPRGSAGRGGRGRGGGAPAGGGGGGRRAGGGGGGARRAASGAAGDGRAGAARARGATRARWGWASQAPARVVLAVI